MGLLCSRSRHHTEDSDENAQVDPPALAFSNTVHSIHAFNLSTSSDAEAPRRPRANLVCINLQAAEIERRIEQEAKAEKHIRKLLLLGM